MYHILIVDDEKIERNGIRFLLKRLELEIEVKEAQNGKAALEILKEEDIDILLTDVKMPFMDGLELIQYAVKIKPNMKIIIFSGYSEFEYAKLALKLGVSDYVLKPVDPKEFENVINKVIGDLESIKEERDLKVKSEEFIKQHILYKLVNCKDIGELQNNNIIDIDFLNDYHKIFLIEFNQDFFGKIGINFLNDIKLNINFKYLNLNLQQAIILFTEKDLNWEQIANILYDEIKEIYNLESYIAISSDISNYKEIPKCIDELETLMENKFYYTQNHIYINDKNKQLQVLQEVSDDTLMKHMKQDIKMKDITSLRKHFERLCNNYKNKTDFSQLYIKFIFSNLLKDIYDNLPDVGEKELNIEIDKLYKSNKFSSVMNIVNLNIERLEKEFSFNPQMTHREIESIKKYICENYNKELSVEQLAEKVFMAPSYLSYIFKKETGQNLSKYIKAYRMEKAKQMLEETHNKIVNISTAVGYTNVSYFCQSFREYFGVSPQKFRNERGGI